MRQSQLSGAAHLVRLLLRYLFSAGVGTIHLVDRDYVEYSNLQRQQLFTEQDALEMIPKVVAS